MFFIKFRWCLEFSHCMYIASASSLENSKRFLWICILCSQSDIYWLRNVFHGRCYWFWAFEPTISKVWEFLIASTQYYQFFRAAEKTDATCLESWEQKIHRMLFDIFSMCGICTPLLHNVWKVYYTVWWPFLYSSKLKGRKWWLIIIRQLISWS